MQKAFLICPVRGQSAQGTEHIVHQLESEGWQVHWPHRDTNQDDPIGYRICCDNRDAIIKSDVVFVVWDGKSQGCLFDLGIAFAMNKPIKVVSLPPLTHGKSFQNMINEWADKGFVLEAQTIHLKDGQILTLPICYNTHGYYVLIGGKHMVVCSGENVWYESPF